MDNGPKNQCNVRLITIFYLLRHIKTIMTGILLLLIGKIMAPGDGNREEPSMVNTSFNSSVTNSAIVRSLYCDSCDVLFGCFDCL